MGMLVCTKCSTASDREDLVSEETGNAGSVWQLSHCQICCHGDGMGLRFATIRIISLTIACIVISLYLVSRCFFLSNFVEIENKLVADDVRRAQNALQANLTRLGLLATDWAAWDDAYQFMEDQRPAFVDSNLTRETFLKQHLAAIAIFDLEGRLVVGRFWNAQTREFTTFAPELLALFTPGRGLLAANDTAEGRQGLVMLAGRPLMVAAYPIRSSENEGPGRGTLVMASWLDEQAMAVLAASTVLDMRLQPLNAPGLPITAADAPPGNAVLVPEAAEAARTISGFGLVRDIFGQPAFWLEVTTERDFFAQGLGLVHYSLGIFILAGAMLFGVLLLFLEKRILRRLRAISRQSALVARGGAPRRLHLPGKDELSRLAAALNVMLDRLDAAKRSLAASEQRYRTLFLGIGAATVLVGRDEVIELANTAFVRLSGLDRETLEGRRRWTDFFPDASVRALAGEPWPEPAEHTLQTSFLRQDGELRHVYLTMALLPAEGARIISLIDNTDARKAEQALADLSRDLEKRVAARTAEVQTKALELETANKRLKELDQVKSTILSSVSHELRTPLTSIRGFANIIERDFDKLVAASDGQSLHIHPRASRIRQNLRIIIEENARLTGLINDFLDLSKIESGKTLWRDSAIDAVELAQRAVRATGALFAETGPVRLTVEVRPETPKLFADFDRMLQVCINLLGNARKFTHEGSVRLHIGLDEQGDWQLCVEDTGMGIAPEDAERIFDSFIQVGDDGGEDKPGGTGLGLTICRTIVTHYGGRIWVRSRSGGGSAFYVALPRAKLFVDPVGTPSV